MTENRAEYTYTTSEVVQLSLLARRNMFVSFTLIQLHFTLVLKIMKNEIDFLQSLSAIEVKLLIFFPVTVLPVCSVNFCGRFKHVECLAHVSSTICGLCVVCNVLTVYCASNMI